MIFGGKVSFIRILSFCFGLAAVITFALLSGINNADPLLNQSASLKPAQSAQTTAAEREQMSATVHLDSIVLGAGCFWGAEKRYQAIEGVVDAISGYADGRGVAPNYQAITQFSNKNNPNNHAEVVKVIFDPTRVNLTDILINYFEGHDPTQLNRQGNDIGTQYRSTILFNSEQQQGVTQQVLSEYQALLNQAGYGKITTKVKALNKFYPAEDYHQDYLVKNPNGYCPDHSTGVSFSQNSAKPSVQASQDFNNDSLLKGKHIVIIDSKNYCPYCEKFKQNVVNDYQGDIKMTFRFADQLDGLVIKSETWATPTILFIEDGKEIFGYQGYLSPKDFYKALGLFKLGDSEAFNVAFDKGTDSRFCKQYEIFNNTPDGVFVDKLSGAALFDTKHRFDSGTGWLSFTQAVKGSVIEKPDNSYGLRRTEIRSKTTNIHLGHVFDDGPNGKPRYCINATVLDFVAR
jgi:peptide methionine sulfoxide reductase msrA/msrB